jgi:carbamoyl-phosphate synthase large subunit
VNVLVTAAGRRTTLVRLFGEAAHARGGRVVAADVDGLAPALFIADDGVRTLRSDDPRYIDDLLETVLRHEIQLLVPTIDTDLPILARHRARFDEAGCTVAISSEPFVAIVMDKYRSGITFERPQIRVPRSWTPPLPSLTELPAQVFVKPRSGSASQDTYRIGRDDLEGILHLVPDPIVQEVLAGPEITIDALLDLEGRPIHFVPRRRIRTLGGESIQGVTLAHDAGFEGWIEQVLEVSSGLGAIGPLTLQAFQTRDGPVLTEINARFGGGFPLAMAAGGSYPAWLLDMVTGQRVEPRLGDYEPGLYMTRHNVEQFTRQPRW